MSDSKCEDTPSACATAGIISASGGGVFFLVGDIGWVRLTEMFEVDVVVPPFDTTLPPTEEPPLKVTVTPPVLVPTPRPTGVARTVSVIGPWVTIPVDGVRVSHG